MDLITLLLIAIGLSMDAFAVAITNGMCVHPMTKKLTLQIGLAFGLAQGVMPTIGYFAGQTFSKAISSMDHWVALILLGAIGGKMVWEALKEMREPEICPVNRTFGMKILFLQAVATSIDALAVGVSFALMKVNIWTAASMIALTTFLFGVAGVLIGKKSGVFLKSKAELAGGAILVLIGIKIFAEHTIQG